jgi:hypothetical protein
VDPAGTCNIERAMPCTGNIHSSTNYQGKRSKILCRHFTLRVLSSLKYVMTEVSGQGAARYHSERSNSGFCCDGDNYVNHPVYKNALMLFCHRGLTISNQRKHTVQLYNKTRLDQYTNLEK